MLFQVLLFKFKNFKRSFDGIITQGHYRLHNLLGKKNGEYVFYKYSKLPLTMLLLNEIAL